MKIINYRKELTEALLELRYIRRELADCFFNLEDMIDFKKYPDQAERSRLWDELYRLQEIYQTGEL